MRLKGALSPEQGREKLAELAARSVAHNRSKVGNKYGAQRTVTEHGAFDSKHEASWIHRLQVLADGGFITGLVSEKRGLLFALDVNGWRVADYEADARFTVVRSFELPTMAGVQVLAEGREYVIDAKSPPTRKKTDYRMKKTLMMALHSIEILEV